MGIYFSNVVFERYADDIVVHCTSKHEAAQLLQAIRERLEQCGLRLHAEKTKIVYCKNSNRKDKHEEVSFDFLGFKFKPKKARNRKTGEIFTDFGPASISKKSMKKMLDTIKTKYLQRRVTEDLADLSRDLDAHVRGWMNYFGKISIRLLYPVMTSINGRLIMWANNRYKSLNGSSWQGRQWLREIYRDYPNMFEHWKYGFKP
jgi:RNA-directed DNA polymerase